MTFTEQILGVPPMLVEQGWRRQPSQDVRAKWLDAGSGHVWDRASIGNLTIHRPVKLASGTQTIVLALYSHAGWGDGLAPTPEMVKVWRFWWVVPEAGDDPEPCEIRDTTGPLEVATYGWGESQWVRVGSYECHAWLGPVLPTVRTP